MAKTRGKWNDEIRNGEIIASEIKLGWCTVSIHHYFGQGDKWFTTCHGIWGRKPLPTETIEESKEIVLDRLKIIFNGVLNQIESIQQANTPDLPPSTR